MTRTRLFLASLAASAVALVGLAPAAGALQVGTPPATLVHVCVTIRGVDSVCVDI